MRELVKSHLEAIIWIWTAISIIGWVVVGLGIIDIGGRLPNGYSFLTGIAAILGGTAGTLAVAGICFQVMDMRAFAKHSAMALHRGRGGDRA